MKAFLAALLVLASWLVPALAAPKASDLVRAELLSEADGIRPGEPFLVGIRLSTREHWHTYWRNPGDSGLATEAKWVLPPGLSAGEIMWPVPERIPVSHLVNYGYEGETTLLVRMVPDASVRAGDTLRIRGDLSYLVCERECIPGEAKLDLALPVAEAGGAPGRNAPLFEEARARLPAPSPWPSRVSADDGTIRLTVEAAGLRADRLADAYFFPFDETAIEHAAPQDSTVTSEGLVMTLKRSNLGSGPVAELGGIVVVSERLDAGVSRQAFEIGRPPAAAASSAAEPVALPVADLSFGSLAQALLLAFAGGLVLNLMPCVFPVLSIKVLSLAKHSGLGPALVRLNGLAYAAGVVASFAVLAAILLALRAAGCEIGWCFQLQSPAFVAALAFLLFAVGLSLSGALELGTGLAGWAGRLSPGPSRGTGLGGSFGTGVLATVVATPCTAPFMGAAVGYGLTAPAPVALGIFAALGLGLAAPFLLLTAAPGLVRRMPRPGAWMEILKQVMAFPVYATVAWLVFVLAQQVGPGGLFAVLIGLVLVGFSAWALRLSAGREGFGGWVFRGAAPLALLARGGPGRAVDRDRVEPGAALAGSPSGGGAEPFTQARLDALRNEGRPVFLNMTAAWCITCMVNERTALSTDAVQAAFKDGRIAYLKGDWTNQNPEITRLLERHGRSGVPLYVLYPVAGEPIVLPQILTSGTLVETLSRAGGSRRADLLTSPGPTATSKE